MLVGDRPDQKHMFDQFRTRYPQGSLTSELVTIDREKYIVRAFIQNNGATLATGLAAANTVEQAEDHARNRALAVLDLDAVAAPEAPAQEASREMPASPPEYQRPTSFSFGNMSQAHSLAELGETTTDEQENYQGREETSANSPSWQEPITSPSLSSQVDNQTAFSFSEPEEDDSSEPAATPAEEVSGVKFPLPEPEKPSASSTSTSSPVDYSDVIAKTNVELKRLGWTNEQGRNYLLQTYGKRSRQLLSSEELLEFLQYLEAQPTPQQNQSADTLHVTSTQSQGT